MSELRKVKLNSGCPEGNMPAENLMQRLQGEGSCPICREYFKDPAIIDCGHSFCRACITQQWEGLDANVSCPQCKETAQQRNLIPNRELANVLEIAKELSLQVIKGPRGEKACGKHQEPLKLFCEEDRAPICVVCDRSQVHRAHTVVPVEEAAQAYKEKIQAHLETLREEREKLLEFKVTGKVKSQEYLIQTETERKKIVSEFEQLQQFLKEQERLLLDQVENLEKEILEVQTDNVSKCSEEISRLSDLISEMEEKCQKPPVEFLQDVRSTLSRCEMVKIQQPLEISPELETRLSDFFQKNIAVTETLKKFKDSFSSELVHQNRESLGSYARVKVILDPDTAHPQLVLSEDGEGVSWGHRWQDLPDSPDRFDTELCVLGHEGFTAGRHCWEVEVGDGRHWAVGVLRESVRRKGWITHNPEGGIWAVQRWGSQFHALTFPESPMPLNRVPGRIRVSLDCEWGQVAFFDAENEAPIFTFPPASFTGERLYPWFWVWTGSSIRLCT